MQVQHIMTKDPLACRPESTLADITRLMWRGDCGFVPVVDYWGRVVDVITDRDICLATTTPGGAPGLLLASDLVRRSTVIACRPEDDVRAALALLVTHRIRRMPVTDDEGRLRGVLSVDDILGAAADLASDLSAADLVDALRTIAGRFGHAASQARGTA